MTVGQNASSAQPGARSICHPARPLVFVLDGQRLRQLRRQRGMSQEALADRAGISAATVGRLDLLTPLPAGAAPWPASPPRSASTQPLSPAPSPPSPRTPAPEQRQPRLSPLAVRTFFTSSRARLRRAGPFRPWAGPAQDRDALREFVRRREGPARSWAGPRGYSATPGRQPARDLRAEALRSRAPPPRRRPAPAGRRHRPQRSLSAAPARMARPSSSHRAVSHRERSQLNGSAARR